MCASIIFKLSHFLSPSFFLNLWWWRGNSWHVISSLKTYDCWHFWNIYTECLHFNEYSYYTYNSFFFKECTQIMWTLYTVAKIKQYMFYRNLKDYSHNILKTVDKHLSTSMKNTRFFRKVTLIFKGFLKYLLKKEKKLVRKVALLQCIIMQNKFISDDNCLSIS